MPDVNMLLSNFVKRKLKKLLIVAVRLNSIRCL